MKLVIAMVAVTMLAVASFSGTAAAKGTLTVSPAPVVLGSPFTLAGDGYLAPTSIAFHVEGPGVDYFTASEPLASISFSQTWIAWWSNPGAYSITSYYRDSKGSLRKVTVVKFTVT